MDGAMKQLSLNQTHTITYGVHQQKQLPRKNSKFQKRYYESEPNSGDFINM